MVLYWNRKHIQNNDSEHLFPSFQSCEWMVSTQNFWVSIEVSLVQRHTHLTIVNRGIFEIPVNLRNYFWFLNSFYHYLLQFSLTLWILLLFSDQYMSKIIVVYDCVNIWSKFNILEQVIILKKRTDFIYYICHQS